MRIFALTIAIFAVMSGIVLISGCDEMNMVKPITQEPAKPDPEVPEPLSREDASNKAYDIVTETGEVMQQKTDEWLGVFFEKHGDRQPSHNEVLQLLEEIKVVVFEKTEVTWEESIDLVELFLEDAFLAEEVSRGSEIINIGAIQMYLTFTFMNPTHTKEELIEEIRSVIETDGLGEFGLQMFIMTYELSRPVPTIYDILPELTSADTIVEYRAKPIDYYQLVDEGLARVVQRFLTPGRPAEKGFNNLIEEEFGFPYNQEIVIQLEQIIREEKDVRPNERINFDPTAMEYLKLRLEFPDKTLEEVFDLFRESVRNNVLPFVRVNQPTPEGEDPEDVPSPAVGEPPAPPEGG